MIRFVLFLTCTSLFQSSFAWQWKDLWQTPDQQGQQLVKKGRFKEAEKTFKRPDWTAAAAYKSGNYPAAAEGFKELHNTEGYYNLGNALARQGQYKQAIKAYDQALNLNPDHEDALYNRKILEDLLKKQQQQNKDQKDKDQKDKDQKNKDQKGKDQKGKDQKNKDQKNKDQKDKDQKGKDQKGKDQKGKDQKGKDQKGKDQKDKDQAGKDRKDKAQKNKDQQSPDMSDARKKAREKEQSKQQWLRVIPDDPGGLMREKFLRDYLKRQRGWLK